MPLKIIGKNPSGSLLEKIKHSSNYKTKGFENLSPTPVMTGDISSFDILKKFLNKSKDTKPSSKIPSVKTDLKNSISNNTQLVWFGHSSYFIRTRGKNILVDPVFSGNASPFSFMIKSFEGSDVYDADDFPAIDYLVLTHDHYDHLDYKTLLKFKAKVKSIYCPLGLSSHLIYWGFDQKIITEMDWWDIANPEDDITIIAAPARHFSGRTAKRFKTLWCSFILKAGSHNLYLGGDSGYDKHFKEIGEKYGPFDIAMLEAGQYNAAWPLIHMIPEQTVEAAIDLKARVLLPVHWGKFSLALHAWTAPVKRVLKAAEKVKLQVTTPMIGEMIVLDKVYPRSHWWESIGKS